MMTTNSWPFLEARALLERTAHKNEVIFQCGYGPSGLPHIGTFSEIARTTMVRNAFRSISDKPTRLIVFSDDMDALRKIPENIPNKENLQKYIGVPLSSVPDPFGCCLSFAQHNNRMLRQFLDYNKFDYEFMSATTCYKSGVFNETLRLISKKLPEIKKIITQGYKAERTRGYCPFLPIHQNITYQNVYDWTIYPNGLPEPFLYWFKNERTLGEIDDRQDVVTPIFNGNVKCQWKLDWPMRWIALGIDYEMHGKDLIDSAQIGHKICKLLKHQGPINFMYELFLDENGEKISKSKGNGLDINEWWKYSTNEILKFYMFSNPRRSRKLYFEVIPKATDEYLRSIDEYKLNPNKDNPVWHVHYDDNIPSIGSPISFGMLLNLVSITNTSNPEIIWRYIKSYQPNISKEKYPILDKLISNAIAYYEDKICPNKVYRIPSSFEKNVLQILIDVIRTTEPTEESLTSEIYAIGKTYYGISKLREFFQMIYEVLMGQISGPRFPVFVLLYGIDNTISAIEEKIK